MKWEKNLENFNNDDEDDLVQGLNFQDIVGINFSLSIDPKDKVVQLELILVKCRHSFKGTNYVQLISVLQETVENGVKLA